MKIIESVADCICDSATRIFPNLKSVISFMRLEFLIKSLGIIFCIGSFCKFYDNAIRNLDSLNLIIQCDNLLREFKQ